MIWKGSIAGHVRDEGAAKLLRLIAEKMDEAVAMTKKMCAAFQVPEHLVGGSAIQLLVERAGTARKPRRRNTK